MDKIRGAALDVAGREDEAADLLVEGVEGHVEDAGVARHEEVGEHEVVLGAREQLVVDELGEGAGGRVAEAIDHDSRLGWSVLQISQLRYVGLRQRNKRETSSETCSAY